MRLSVHQPQPTLEFGIRIKLRSGGARQGLTSPVFLFPTSPDTALRGGNRSPTEIHSTWFGGFRLEEPHEAELEIGEGLTESTIH